MNLPTVRSDRTEIKGSRSDHLPSPSFAVFAAHVLPQHHPSLCPSPSASPLTSSSCHAAITSTTRETPLASRPATPKQHQKQTSQQRLTTTATGCTGPVIPGGCNLDSESAGLLCCLHAHNKEAVCQPLLLTRLSVLCPSTTSQLCVRRHFFAPPKHWRSYQDMVQPYVTAEGQVRIFV